jgi:PQQ-like domain
MKIAQTSFDRKFVAILTLFLMISVVFTVNALPQASAHTPPVTYPTVAGIIARPNPVGVGQQVGILMFIDKAPPLGTGDYGERYHNYTVTITKPDNTTETLGPFDSDAISFGYAYYTPTQIGTYTLLFHFPKTLIVNENLPPANYNIGTNNNNVFEPEKLNDTYAASDSEPYALLVQQDPVALYPSSALPTDYWTSPVSALNREWYAITGDWLGGAQINSAGSTQSGIGPVPFTTAPETAHILWTEPFWTGGIAGGADGSYSYLTSAGRDNSAPIIINGVIYLNNFGSNSASYGWSAVSLYTGQTLWSKSSTSGMPYPSFASEYLHNSLSQQVVKPYLWSVSGSTWMAVDPYSGTLVFNITNVPSGGYAVYGTDGSILRYSLVNYGTTANPNMYLLTWNNSEVLSPIEAYSPNRPGGYSGNFDGRLGYATVGGNVSVPAVQGTIFDVIQDKWIIGGTPGTQNLTATKPGNLWTISLAPGQVGTLLSNITFTPPKQAMDSGEYYYYGTGASPGAGGMHGPWVYSQYNVFVYYEGVTRTWWGFDLTTGQQLWKSTPQGSLMSFSGGNPYVAYGVLYTSPLINEPGGEVHAYNITTGKELWVYYGGYNGGDSYYDNIPVSINMIQDGKIYTVSKEHIPIQPLRRDAALTCIDAFNGTVYWQMPYFSRNALADARGYLVAQNEMDNQMYVFGKGPSATTVAGPDTVQPFGVSVILTGSVTDQSPGALSKSNGAIGVNNAPIPTKASDTPAVSDESMTAWMKYIYMQQPMPNVKGVPVSLDALDPNGNFVHIGSVTTDGSGKYSCKFTPQVPGDYTVIASFAGSKSYGSSSAETAISISESPTATNAPSPIPQSAADMYFVPAIAAIIVANVIGFALLAILVLRKRP